MTDHPRFQIVNGEPDRCYRQYHGSALVALVFKAADWWLKHRDTTTTVRPVSCNPVGRMHHDAPQC